ncbi:MAG: type II methionyl aminopeptidase [Desulfurococcaceae archaeon]
MMLNEEAVKKLIQAGHIAKRAVELASKLVKPGKSVSEIATTIENYIRELGGAPAFPVNIGINAIAAHYTPVYNDTLVIPDQSVVKIDVGVHVDGYIADTAITVVLSPAFEGLVEAVQKALEKALEIIHPGIRAIEVGRVIEATIRSYGFKPIKNLSGHGIDRYIIHSGVTIPNYVDILARHRLATGVYAIEPFATTGIGLVRELDLVTIYALKQARGVLNNSAKRLYERIYKERLTLPFTLRWYVTSSEEYEECLKTLELLDQRRLLVKYPVLVEKSNAHVSQFEHTVVITDKDVVVTTL